MTNIFDSVKNWAKKPFSTDMNLGQWFLFLGLAIIISAFWNRVLHDIIE